MNISKFKTLTGYNIRQIDVKHYVPQKKYNMCLVYCAWNRQQYIDLLYISLISQLKYTDVLSIDIKIFVSSKLCQYALYVLRDMPAEIIVISEFFNKYSITTHESLKEYDKIIISDCDTFMYGTPQSFYNIVNSYNQGHILMMEDPDVNTETIFRHRIILSKMPKYFYKYYHSLVSSLMSVTTDDFNDILSKNRWYLSCMMIFSRHLYSGPEWQKYINHYLHDIATGCDETVFLTYAWKNGYTTASIDVLSNDIRVVPATQTRNFMSNTIGLGIMHPLHGEFCHDMLVQELYDKIIKNES